MSETQAPSDTTALVDPSKCKVDGPGLTSAELKQETYIEVTTMQPNGTPTEDPLKVTAEWKSLVDGSVFQLPGLRQEEANKYKIDIYANVRGRHQLTVFVNGQPVAGSPFPVYVKIRPTQLGRQSVRIIPNLFYPSSIAINSAEEIVVAEYRTISVFDKKGEKLDSFKMPTDEGHSNGLAVDEDDNMYVVDRVRQCVEKYSKKGKFLKSVGDYDKRGSGPSQFNEPKDVTVIGDEIFVCDKDNHRLQVFKKETLEFVKEIGSRGRGDEEFKKPYDVAQDEVGNMYVSDHGNNRVKVLNKQGEFQFSISKKANGQLNGPTGVCVDDHFLYVAEHGVPCISLFKKDGQFVTSFGKGGCAKGEFTWPYGICVDCDGFVYVCDHGNHRVQVF